jgi:predicted phosphodiesterase
MRYGVFADVHSNLEALEAVLAFYKKERVQAFLCIGDIVGYGPNPNECIQLLSALNKIQITAGNHDYAVVGLKELTWFNSFASRSLVWTRRQLKEENRNFLMRLPRLVDGSVYTLAHGSPRDPVDEYLLTARQYLDNLPHFRTPVCFIGHTHVPSVFYTDSLGMIQHTALADGETYKLDAQAKTIVNVGSVGQPRDGDPRACAMIYDTDKMELRVRRIKYDVEAVQQKMREARLPLFLIERLGYGR